MLRRSFFCGTLALVAALLILAGCEGPFGLVGLAGNIEEFSGDEGGPQGPRVLTVLNGSLETKMIQSYIDDNYDIEFAGVIQSDEGIVIIPEARASNPVKFRGSSAYTLHNGGTLMIEAAGSVTFQSGAKIYTGGGAVAAPANIDIPGISPENLKTLQPGSGEINTTESLIYIHGPVTLPSGNYGQKTFNVLGNATVAGGITEATAVNVSGNLTVNAPLKANTIRARGAVTAGAAITGALQSGGAVTFTAPQTFLTGLTAASVTGLAIEASGDISVTGAITAASVTTTGDGSGLIAGGLALSEGLLGSGDVTVTGALSANGVVTITGALQAGSIIVSAGAANNGPPNNLSAASIDVTGTLVVDDNLTLNGGGLTVGGGATVGGTVTTDDAASIFTFNGATTITGGITLRGALTIAGRGGVTLTAALPTTNTITIRNTGGVTIAAESVIAANLTAAGVIVAGNGNTGVVINSNAALTVPAGASITVPADTGRIVAGDNANTITINGAILAGAGQNNNALAAYTATGGGLALSNGAVITLTGSGSVAEIAGTGALTFAAANDILLLKPQAELRVLANTGDISGAGDNNPVNLAVYATGSKTCTRAARTGTGTGFVLTTTLGNGDTPTVTLGQVAFTLTNPGNPQAFAGANAGDNAAAGSLTAGLGTDLALYGADPQAQEEAQ
jgi:filamentous hemagglutinin